MAPPGIMDDLGRLAFWRSNSTKSFVSTPSTLSRQTEEHTARLEKLFQEREDREKEHRREVSALTREVAEYKRREESTALSYRTEQEEEFRRKIRSLENEIGDVKAQRQARESLLNDEIQNLNKTVEDSKGENSSLSDRVAELKTAERGHRQAETAHLEKIAKLEKKVQRQTDKISTLESGINSLNDQIETASKTAKEHHEREESRWTAEVTEAKKELEKYWWQVSQLEPEVVRLQQENKRLDQARRKASARVKELEAELREKVELAHNYAKTILDKNKNFAASDADIKAWFQSRSKSWYGWARDFAHSDPGKIAALPLKEKEEFLSATTPFVLLEKEGLPQELVGKKRTVHVLLHAMLANSICTDAIASPFWYLEAINQGSDPTLPAEEGMGNLYKLLTSLREPEAHQWRATMSRIMSTSGIGQSGNLRAKGAGALEETSQLASYRRQYAQHLATAFLKGPSRFLLRDKLTDTCAGRLTEEIDNALKFSVTLWSGRSDIQMEGLEDFQERFQGKFKQGSDEMELHRGNKGEDVKAYRDQPILVVVQPAIVALGTEEGDEYDSARRVWMKAQVNVMEPTPTDMVL
ncbi:hypothetical protein B0H67DRAFT_108878 [Lasiosphaeris hirsuta]|uniref:Uncharacterized protein n=1 Tax=Lasiosphaeris hirsuta TaxID=260670 RepID=A0AA40E2G9_9PEZI|nr:hypothetical protein B0H67DRAFT_108878 [Lasiosphaeris hirsuta]